MQRRQHSDSIFYYTNHTADWNVQPIESLSGEITVPISIFSGKTPALQAIVRYLREHEQLPYKEIAALLGRAESTIRVTHRNAPRDEQTIEPGLAIPATYFREFGLSPLENVVFFLQQQQLRNVEIAALLNLDPRTTATVSRRIKNKGVVLHA